MKRNFIMTSLILFLAIGLLAAQETTDEKKQNIFESLSTPDSITKAKVVVHQDDRIEQLILNKKSYPNSQRQANFNGYRVQVFSSNAQKTAKNEAFKIEKLIRETFPEEEVYVNYTSPFWKVRVGDFDTMQKAQSFRSQLIEVFPEIKSDTYIVREQVHISVSK